MGIHKKRQPRSDWVNGQQDTEANEKFLSSESEDEVYIKADERLRVRMASEGYNALEKLETEDEDKHLVDRQTKNGTRSEKQLWAMLVICLLVINSLVVVIIVTHIKVDKVYKQCQTADCIKAAGDMMSRMDLSVDPCEDFYTYSCGNWEKNALPPPDKPKWNAFSEVYTQNIGILNKLINKVSSPCPYKGKNSTAICKAKDYYTACKNMSATDANGNIPVLKFIKMLGSWTLTSDPVSGHWDRSTWDFMDTLVKMKAYSISPLFGMEIGPDDKNSSRNIIFFEQSGLTLGDSREYNNTHTEKYHRAFTKFARKLMSLLGASKNHTDEKIQQVWNFEKKLASIFVPKSELQDSEAIYHKMTVADLQNLVNHTINMKDYMDRVFRADIPLSQDVVVYTPTYMTAVAEVIRTEDKEILANYMMLHAVYAVLPYLPEAFEEATLILKSATKGITGFPPRWQICVSRIDDVFGFATGALFVQEKFSDESKSKAEDIVENVRQAFIDDLPSVTWMDDETKDVAADKARAVHKMIGYPDWILSPPKLDDYYAKLSVTSDNQFENALNAKLFFAKKELDKRDKSPDNTEWHMMPAEVNAYYNSGYNQIVFPAGILQRPFYGAHFPMPRMYGAIGSVVGHELTHGFDNHGSKYDKTGNMRDWWNQKSRDAFKKQTSCMIDQYSQYSFGGEKVNGLTTLGENIADNGGLKSAYKAFQKWSKSHEHNSVSLPGLNMTESQLFFLGFAQIWCAYYTPEYARTSLLTDPHSPAKIRVIAALSNNQNFSVAYGCKSGSRMNPENKCTLW